MRSIHPYNSITESLVEEFSNYNILIISSLISINKQRGEMFYIIPIRFTIKIIKNNNNKHPIYFQTILLLQPSWKSLIYETLGVWRVINYKSVSLRQYLWFFTTANLYSALPKESTYEYYISTCVWYCLRLCKQTMPFWSISACDKITIMPFIAR